LVFIISFSGFISCSHLYGAYCCWVSISYYHHHPYHSSYHLDQCCYFSSQYFNIIIFHILLSNLVFISLSFVLFLIFFNFHSNLFCFVYPAYQTYKTLEGKHLTVSHTTSSPISLPDGSIINSDPSLSLSHNNQGISNHSSSPLSTPSIESDASIALHNFWLTYWIVYGLFRSLEFIADFLFLRPNNYLYPYYKLLFLLWCFHSSTRGCIYLHTYIIRPLFLPREQLIDEKADQIINFISAALFEVRGVILRYIAQYLAGNASNNDPLLSTPRQSFSEQKKIR
jgi:hypothetical protein